MENVNVSFSNQVQQIIYEIMNDRLPHTLKEVRERCKDAGIDVNGKDGTLYTLVHRLKQNGKIRSTGEKGTYILASETECAKEDRSTEKDKQENAAQETAEKVSEWDRADILWPDEKNDGGLRVSINDKGEIRLNKAFLRKIETKTVAIRFNNNYKVILLREMLSGDGVYKCTNGGIIRNRRIVSELKKRNFQFPVTYVVIWDEKEKFWRGSLRQKDSNG